MPPTDDVDEFIEAAPADYRAKLRAMRAAIRAAAPGAVESMSYGMPFYSFPGESGFGARLCYFGVRKKEALFYTRPRFLEDHLAEVEPYLTSRSSLHFPLDRPIPTQLIKKLVRNAVKKHSAGDAS